ncbi:unnamed protein product [Onchocerca ochengi]|uniref:Major sperm protein n=1 Tax=Onchocerca ochengi TaxID=42157 RepID=A0A182EKZ3_ONCOC|nr:unnamed protein product [Onchocerca ochengi]
MSMMALKNDYTVESKNKEKKPLRRSLLKFAVEKEQPTVAHVKLLLCNNSNHQLQWILKCTDNAIKAEPTMSGHIGMFGTDQVNLMWQRPKNISMWTDMPSPKLQLFIKLIAVTTGAEVTDGSAKFKAVINPEAECTINDLPIHKIIFKSETISERSTNDESNLKNDIDSETDHPKGFLENPDMLFWLIVIVCCFLGAIILQSLDDEYRGPRKHNYD